MLRWIGGCASLATACKFRHCLQHQAGDWNGSSLPGARRRSPLQQCWRPHLALPDFFLTFPHHHRLTH